MMASSTERSRTTAFPPNSGMKAMSAAAFPAAMSMPGACMLSESMVRSRGKPSRSFFTEM